MIPSGPSQLTSTHEGRSPELWWVGGWMHGWVDGLWYFTLFNFLHTFRVYRWCMYIIIFIVNGCHQDPYGFQNLASNWRVGSWISKLPYNGDFSDFRPKSVYFFSKLPYNGDLYDFRYKTLFFILKFPLLFYFFVSFVFVIKRCFLLIISFTF